jgi:DNA repair protein RecO (recombination protein O)
MKAITRAIVLNTTPYSESSLVVKAYTEISGLRSYIVSGVRTGKGKFHSNLFQPLTLLEIVTSGKPGQSLTRITDASLAPPLTGISGDISKSTMAIFMSEVIYRSIKEEEHNPGLFGFLHNAIQILDLARHDYSRFHLYFMIGLTRYTGFYPHGIWQGSKTKFDLREGIFTESLPSHPEYTEGSITDAIWNLMGRSFENYHESIIPSPVARVMLHALIRYYELHVTQGKKIVSHKILEEVLG